MDPCAPAGEPTTLKLGEDQGIHQASGESRTLASKGYTRRRRWRPHKVMIIRKGRTAAVVVAWLCTSPRRALCRCACISKITHALPGTSPSTQPAGATGFKAKSRCLAVFGDYPPALVELLRRTDPDTVTEHGYFATDVAALTGVRVYGEGGAGGLGLVPSVAGWHNWCCWWLVLRCGRCVGKHTYVHDIVYVKA